MLNLVDALQRGFTSSTSFVRNVVTDRMENLELASGAIETEHSTVTCLNIDRVEDSYLLSGNKEGGVKINKLNIIPNLLSYTCGVLGKSKLSDCHAHSVETVQWYPFDNGIFTSSGMDGFLKLWSTSRFRVVETFHLPNRIYQHHMSTIATHHSLVAAAMFHPQVILVDVRSGSQSHHLQGHHQGVSSVQWSPFAEHLLATGGMDNKILLWDIRSAKGYLKSLDQYNGEALSNKKDLITAHNGRVNGLCFTSDGLFLASYGTDNSIKLWDVALGKNTLVNFGKVVNEFIKNVQITMCCDTSTPILFVPSQKKIELFELFTGARMNSLCGHMSTLTCCTFRNQFHELYSAGKDNQVLIWSTENLTPMLDKRSRDPRYIDLWSDDSDVEEH